MNTTIQISKETKELISSYGIKGETYEDIIKKLYKLANERVLQKFMEPSDEYMSLDDFSEYINQDD